MGHALRKEEFTASPVNTNVCQSFRAELGAEVTFLGVTASTQISQSGSVWPFCGPNGSTLNSPITFPRPGNSNVYIKSTGLQVGNVYNYDVDSNCANETTKSVTIIT